MAKTDLTIPNKGIPRKDLLQRLGTLASQDVDFKGNRVFGLVYQLSDEHTDFLKAAHGQFFSANGLNPMAFKSLKRMESDVVRMTASLFNGGNGVVGTLTSGGTESILLAVLAYREHARRHRPWVLRPEIIVPASAHAAFYKAGQYFDVKIVRAPLDKDFRADVNAVRKRINWKTIAIVASAPCYPYGVIDPVQELAQLAAARGIGMHVDACLGGYLLPFVGRLPADQRPCDIPPFDFGVPGVTSMSADVHKYGYAAKGASTLLYRNMDYLKHQFSVETEWCGGVYVSPTLAGTRPGGAIAGAWAALNAIGEDGYLANAANLMQVTRTYLEGIRQTPGLCILGNPVMSVLSFGAAKGGPDIYAVGDFLEARGWHIDRIQNPAGLHLILNPGHAGVAAAWLADLREGVAYVLAHPEAAAEGSAPMYGMIAKLPLRGLVKKNVLAFMQRMYSDEDVDSVLSSSGTEEDGSATGGATDDGVPLILRKLLRAKARLTKFRERF
jgi:glutamate/tyrosine decarboxylase-like PLP-dependent enzyme